MAFEVLEVSQESAVPIGKHNEQNIQEGFEGDITQRARANTPTPMATYKLLKKTSA